jgi:hypothetical protein
MFGSFGAKFPLIESSPQRNSIAHYRPDRRVVANDIVSGVGDLADAGAAGVIGPDFASGTAQAATSFIAHHTPAAWAAAWARAVQRGSQVYKRLSSGGSRIRTIGSAQEDTRLDPRSGYLIRTLQAGAKDRVGENRWNRSVARTQRSTIFVDSAVCWRSPND